MPVLFCFFFFPSFIIVEETDLSLIIGWKTYKEAKSLSLVQRLNIAIEVACALDYLHNHHETPIVHCDLKPSNVLLDSDLTGHVSNFGLSRFLSEPTNNVSINQSSSIEISGSVGYAASGNFPHILHIYLSHLLLHNAILFFKYSCSDKCLITLFKLVSMV
ncbi:putative protein kinase RLK-Pelle-LRR-XII-1 family [Rosa chinensis]|uniref:Protein kinase domain-containing protein n=1 Tax=Rosa chinensis TaxID=74649 RepID=A0A2P6SA19_ROSCH|nr:putative protein kinase RLK-Pelle-LRR-XII-1 family [Rosa chinensis]